MTGVMEGHWDSVVLAYTISVLTMAVYLGSVLARVRAAANAVTAVKNVARTGDKS